MNDRVESRRSAVTEIGSEETELENNLECGAHTYHYPLKLKVLKVGEGKNMEIF